MIHRVIFHIDFDYFYAQCEEIRDPKLKTIPVCVCVYSDRGGDSGAIATANYKARKFGVKSGMPIRQAKSKLANTNAVFLPTDFDYYSQTSEKAMGIIQEFADVFEYVGRDEAYLDLTKSTEGDYDKATHIAQQIKNLIRTKIKLTCSIGISPNKLLSKIASDYKKPDGLTVILPEHVKSFLESIKIGDIPGIGKKTENKLAEMGVETIRQLRDIDIFTLNKKFGRKTAEFIYRSCRGIDDQPVAEKEPSIQFSKIITLKHDSLEFNFLHKNLQEICKELHDIVLKKKKRFKLVGIQFVQTDLTNRTRSKMLKSPTSTMAELEKTATTLLYEALEDQQKPIRRLGVKVSELSDMRGQYSIDSYF